MKALQGFLRPEFINRVDEVITFRPLTREDFSAIARIMLDELKDVLKERGLTFTYTDPVARFIADESYSERYGARNMRRETWRIPSPKPSLPTTVTRCRRFACVSVTASWQLMPCKGLLCQRSKRKPDLQPVTMPETSAAVRGGASTRLPFRRERFCTI